MCCVLCVAGHNGCIDTGVEKLKEIGGLDETPKDQCNCQFDDELGIVALQKPLAESATL